MPIQEENEKRQPTSAMTNYRFVRAVRFSTLSISLLSSLSFSLSSHDLHVVGIKNEALVDDDLHKEMQNRLGDHSYSRRYNQNILTNGEHIPSI